MKLPPISRGAAYAVTFLFVLSFVLAGLSYVLSVQAVHRGQRNAASITQLCESGNFARGQQVQLWDHLLAISIPRPNESRAHRIHRQQVARAFKIYVHHVFAARDCAHPGRNP